MVNRSPKQHGADMTFVSYAQNFEDVMLWRALKHIERGFYIDIGAWSPERDSVTQAFYERGWSGINVEPNAKFIEQLQARRPNDINLCLVIGAREGRATLNILGDSGLSTLDDAMAEKHRRVGSPLERQERQVVSLSALWRRHVVAGREVHFLKVDVEGSEYSVLQGNDWTLNRPWVVVAEAMLPTAQVECHEVWEPLLVSANYRFAYADGLNRFYVADEHVELLHAFRYPPNVFDNFVLDRQRRAEARAEAAEIRAKAADSRLARITTSLPWRISAPLRWAFRMANGRFR